MKDAFPQTNHPGGRPRKEVSDEELRRLLKEGRSLRQIARLLACGYGTVHRAAKRLPDMSEAIQNSLTRSKTT